MKKKKKKTFPSEFQKFIQPICRFRSTHCIGCFNLLLLCFSFVLVWFYFSFVFVFVLFFVIVVALVYVLFMFCFVFLIYFFLFVSFVIVVVFCFVLFFVDFFIFISPGFCMCFTLETMRIRIACCLELLVVKLHVGRFLSVSVRLSYQKECLGVITEITKLGGICANALLCLEQSSSHLLPTPTVSVTGHFLVVYSSKTERQTVRRGRQRQRKKNMCTGLGALFLSVFRRFLTDWRVSSSLL